MTISESEQPSLSTPPPSDDNKNTNNNNKKKRTHDALTASASVAADSSVRASSSSMKIIPPSNETESHAQALEYLHQLGTTILPKSHRYFQKFMNTTASNNNNDESVRRIQTNRLEIFVHNASDKGSKAIDGLLKKHHLDPETVKQSILQYATSQALKDERLQPPPPHYQNTTTTTHTNNYKFGNFSLIVNYGPVHAQAPHVDLLEPNFQFGMMVSPGPGTLWYDCPHKVSTTQELVNAWKRTDALDHEQQQHQQQSDNTQNHASSSSSSLPTFPEKLPTILDSSPAVQTLLQGYGNVLVPDEELVESQVSHAHLPVGTLCSLPGSVVHAGPATPGFRAVLFFSAWPMNLKDNKVQEYDPDTQYGSVFLCGRISQLLWRHVRVDYEVRRYLLYKLYRYICQGGNNNSRRQDRVVRNWYSHFPYDAWSAVVKRLEEQQQQPPQAGHNNNNHEDRAFIDAAARNETLNFYNIQGSIDRTLPGDFVRASLPNLYSDWEGESYEVHIFVRPLDGKTLLFYPMDRSQLGENSWEGTKDEDCYSLTPHSSSHDHHPVLTLDTPPWFDGTNGVLKDSDGDVIQCHVKEGATPTPILGHGDGITWHQAKENESIRRIAKKYGVDADLVVQVNRFRIPNLETTSRLKAGTKVIVAPLQQPHAAPPVMVHRSGSRPTPEENPVPLVFEDTTTNAKVEHDDNAATMVQQLATNTTAAVSLVESAVSSTATSSNKSTRLTENGDNNESGTYLSGSFNSLISPHPNMSEEVIDMDDSTLVEVDNPPQDQRAPQRTPTATNMLTTSHQQAHGLHTTNTALMICIALMSITAVASYIPQLKAKRSLWIRQNGFGPKGTSMDYLCTPLALQSGDESDDLDESTLEKFKSQIEKVQSKIENVESEIKEVKSEIKEVKGKIAKAEGKIENIESEIKEVKIEIVKSNSEKEKEQLRDKEKRLENEKEQLRDKEKRLENKEEQLRDKEKRLENKENNLRNQQTLLLQEKQRLEQQEGIPNPDRRIATITFKMEEEVLQKDETIRFASRVWDLFEWHTDKDMRSRLLAPYFPVVQSSGSGKTKMMALFRNGTSISNSNNNGESVGTTSQLLSPEDEGKWGHFDPEADATIIFLLCYHEGSSEPSLDGVFDGLLPVPLSTQDHDRTRLLKVLDTMACKAGTNRIVFLFDEAQHLLRNSWHFRCIRWWLRQSNPEHGKQVVAVFAGTTSQLTKFHEDIPKSTTTRNPRSAYHESGSELYPPFYQLYTTGLYKWKRGYKMPLDATEFEKSVVYGRPLFAGLLEESRKDFWNAQPNILLKLLISSPTDWPGDRLAKASILGTRLQMGDTSLQIASDLVAKGYATLTCYNEAGNYAQIAYLPDPVLARLAMCFMIPEYNGMEIPRNCKSLANCNNRSWSGYMADLFSNAICRADTGDVGEIGVALYLLLCGDRLRYACDPQLETLSICLDHFLEFAMDPNIEDFNTLHTPDDPDITLNFIQVTREHLRFRNVSQAFPMSDWYLRSLYESARGTYAVDSRPVFDLLVPIRLKDKSVMESGEQCDIFVHVPMLVSVKNKYKFSANQATSALVDMRKLMDELRDDKKGIAVLVLVGINAPQWKSTFSKSLLNATGIDGISYDNQLEKQRMQLTREGKGEFIIVIPEDDPFGVSQSLRCCAVNEREGAVHQSALDIKTAAFKFLEKEFQGKEGLLWYEDASCSKSQETVLRLIEEVNNCDA